MESRFRRLISIKRRDKTSPPVERRTGSRHSDFSQWSTPVSVSRFSPGTPVESNSIHEENQDCLLQSIPYDAVVAGRTPIFTSECVRGNGPVKVQAMRRSSSGELMSTVQDNRRTLDDILEGDYIVGGKDKYDSRGRPDRCVISPATPALSTAVSSPRSPLSMGFLPQTPVSSCVQSPCEPLEDIYHESTGCVRQGLGILSTPASTPQAQSCQWGESLTDLDGSSRISRASTATSPSVQVPEERNATIAALWKAECGRLASMYGREKIQRTMPRLGGENETSWCFPIPPTKSYGRTPEVVLDPLPHPNIEKCTDSTRRASNISAVSSFTRDDNSDASSNKRASLVSSFAASSSCTLQTTMTDHDAVTTREDIHKLVDQMRANYLRALELNAPSMPTTSHSTKKKRRVKRGPPAARSSLKPSPMPLDRQTWHGDDVHESENQPKTKSTRITSHPPTAFGRLSPIESSSPPREPRPTNRLHRADSTTLGSVLAKMKPNGDPADTIPKGALHQKKALSPVGNRTIRLVDDEHQLTHYSTPSIPRSTTVTPINNFF